MPEIGHAVVVDEIRRTTLSTSFNNMLNCKIDAADLEGNTEYLIICSTFHTGGDVNDNSFQLRLSVSGSQLGDSYQRIEPRNTSSRTGEQYFWMDRYTTPATPVDIQLQGRNLTTAKINRVFGFYMVALKLADLLDTDWEDDENTTALTGLSSASWTNGCSITIGDGQSDWLVFGYANVSVNVGPTTRIHMRLTDDDTLVGDVMQMEGEDPIEERQIGSMWALEKLPNSVIDLDFQTNTGTGNRVVNRCYLFALRLNAFQDHLIGNDTTDTTMSVIDTYYGTISVSHTTRQGGVNRDWAVFGRSVYDATGDNSGQFRHHIRDDTTVLLGESTDLAGGVNQSMAGAVADIIHNVKLGEYAAVTHGQSITANMKALEDADVIPAKTLTDQTLAWFTWELAQPHRPYFNKRPRTYLRM